MIETKDKLIWRMEKQCEDCPFAHHGPGLHLRRTLQHGRWRGILHALSDDNHFLCHKTSEETGNGTNLVCAGAIEWQQKRGLSSRLQRMAEWLLEQKHAIRSEK